MKIQKVNITPRRRANLIKLADYLESLPYDYAHFDMSVYSGHTGKCDLGSNLGDEVRAAIAFESAERHWDADEEADTVRDNLYASSISSFLGNCGAIACAVGHGPAAGIDLAKAHIKTKRVNGAPLVTGIRFDHYAKNFVANTNSYDSEWCWLFSGDWESYDSHHWGAAARIRFFLDKGGYPVSVKWTGAEPSLVYFSDEVVKLYEGYRVDRRVPGAPAC